MGTTRSSNPEQQPNVIPLLREKDAPPRTPPTVAFLMGALVAITAMQLGTVMRAAERGTQPLAVFSASR